MTRDGPEVWAALRFELLPTGEIWVRASNDRHPRWSPELLAPHAPARVVPLPPGLKGLARSLQVTTDLESLLAPPAQPPPYPLAPLFLSTPRRLGGLPLEQLADAV